MIWGILIGLVVGVSLGTMLAGLLAGASTGDRDEYVRAVDELGKALREAYSFIEATGEWDEFESTGYTVDPPTSSVLTDAERRELRSSRAWARFYGPGPVRAAPLGHTRLGIDPSARRRGTTLDSGRGK